MPRTIPRTPSSARAVKDGITKKVKNLLASSDAMHEVNKPWAERDLNEAILSYLATYMFDVSNQDKISWFEEYVRNYLTTASKDPNSKPAQQIANALFNESFIRQICEHLSAQREHDLDFKTYQLRSTLYDKQQQLFDNNIDQRIVVINSRRSGKTETMGRIIARELLQPDAHVVYLNRTSSAAVRQIREPLRVSLEKIGLKSIKGSVDNQEVHYENGSQLLVLGNNNSADIDKLRGERISCCIMDECGHQRNVKQIMREVVGPALKDYGSKSKLYLVGTPPRIPHTYVEELWNNPEVKKYHWTFLDNPFIPDRDKVIEQVCKDEKVEPNSAFIRREYLGEMGVYDDDAKYITKYTYNPQETLPNTLDFAYIGVDWGYEDKAAVISIVANKQKGQAYIVETWSEPHKGIKEISDEILRQYNNLKSKYNLARQPWVICDNNEKSAVSDLYHQYHIPNVFTAYKYDKDYALDQLHEMFATNKIVVVNDPSGRVLQDIDSTLWRRDEETDRILHELDDDIWHPNALFAILYVSRQLAIDIFGWIDSNKAAKAIIES